MRFDTLSSFVLAVLALKVLGSPTGATTSPVDATDDTSSASTVATSVVSVAEMKNWLATTDANLTFIGEPIENLGISPFVITVTYCSTRAASLCSGPCTVFTGSNVCLNAPNTNCLSATGNVAFCDHGGCSGSCNTFDSCGTRLDDGFCATPGTNSISVPIS